VTLVWTPGYDDGSTYTPGKLVLKKEFGVQGYMYEFPPQYPLWTPANITTALWLDAADASTITTVSGAVSQWDDKSGNGTNVAQATSSNRPTIASSFQNSRNALLFDGSNDFLESAGNFSITGNPSFSVFMASRNFSAAIGWGANAVAQGAGFISNGFAFMGGNTFTFNTIPAADTSTIIGFRKTAGAISGSSNLFENGVINQASSGQPIATPNIASQKLRIGRLNEFSLFFNGHVFEIIVLNSAASLDTRQRIEGYLAHKWGLTANLPSDHPYKTAGPTP